ncbi:hypothetical protein [Crocinitomix catalasitica]|uniref:hypothetical protein n=1 Tax=Crocinitomix catalasitica TaxID=184607 RepID=UPI000485711F|nr:hypothetical protein [Crocinitomix catalasitica]
MKNTIKELHQAAQYLAAAGISFLDKQADDSHTNVGWNSNKNRMETHVFGAQNQLAINLNSGNIEWLKNGAVSSEASINSNSHNEIVHWIKEQAKENKISNSISYNFHYKLPYDDMINDYQFSLSTEKLKKIAKELSKAQNAFEQFLENEKLDSPIRIWPHHFDLGIYAKLETENTFMGAGIAIPDTLVDDFYFYASGYKNGAAIVTKTFEEMEVGNWRTDWNGATIAATNLDDKTALTFLTEAKNKFDQ